MTKGKKMDKITMSLMWMEMLKEQDKDGFDLTVRDLQKLWGYATTSAVHYALSKLVEAGLVKTKNQGSVRVYRAKHEGEINWPKFYDLYSGEYHESTTDVSPTHYSPDWVEISGDTEYERDASAAVKRVRGYVPE